MGLAINSRAKMRNKSCIQKKLIVNDVGFAAELLSADIVKSK